MKIWHDVKPGTRESINVIVEIPRGSHNKYELDKETGLIKLDRANYGPAPYPVEYGFIQKTLAEHGDPMDVLLFSTFPIHPGVLVSMRPVAFMEMIDGGEVDNKIIGVPVDDHRWDDVKDLPDLNKHSLREIQDFFENLKALKNKPVEILIKGFKGKKEAEKAFEEGLKLYAEKYSQGAK